MRFSTPLAIGVVALTLGCQPATEPTEVPATKPVQPPPSTEASIGGFAWTTASPESQGMCGSTKQLGCTKTLQAVWNGISDPRYNTKRFTVIRNDKVIAP